LVSVAKLSHKIFVTNILPVYKAGGKSMEYLRFNVRNKETGAIEEKIVPKDVIYTEEYEKAFEFFHAAQPDADTNLRAMYLYRSIVDEFSLEQLKSVPPYIVADYARYQILREEFFDRSREKVCPYCEETVKLTDMHKRSYDEIAVALMRLIKLYSGELEVGIHAI
jgi:hypothetical protein